MQLNIRKISLIVGLPLAAVALALFVMSMGNGTTRVHAAVDPNVDMSLSMTGCDSSSGPTKCNLADNGVATVSFNVKAIPAGGYSGYDLLVNFAGNINYNVGSLNQAFGSPPQPPVGFACDFPTGEVLTGTMKPGGTEIGNGTMSAACAQGLVGGNPKPASNFIGVVATFQITCKKASAGTLTLVHGDGITDLLDPGLGSHSEAADESLTINCVPAPTATPVPPTATPPPQPRVFKSPALQNVFLHRQGTKIPPSRCEASTDVGTLSEGINIPISSQDPKGITGFQQLAAFEFEVRFDPSLVCVSIVGGPDWTAANGAICSALVNEGLIRFGCVTTGKGHNLNASVAGCGDADPLTPCNPLAIISVRPQAELYSQLRPNQDNGIPVQILNQGCELADEQGHPIPIFSCEDADITFRFLEGDVDGPDCDVDVLDAQQVAFRWGAEKGALLYNTFMDLEPSGQVKGDGDIDIKDLQFVFGRLGSTCTAQWPPQPPVNPKA